MRIRSLFTCLAFVTLLPTVVAACSSAASDATGASAEEQTASTHQADSCGGFLQTPCPGNVCTDGHFDPAWGLCDHCGEAGQSCCNHGNAPVTQDCYNWSQCSDPTVGYGKCVACGQTNQSPCTSGPACAPGFVLSNNLCVAPAACGGMLQPPCPGSSCKEGHYDPGSNLCDHCGEIGNYCCNHGNAPVTADCYGMSKCSDPSVGYGKCVACGEIGQAPCPGDVCDAAGGAMLWQGGCVAAAGCGEIGKPECQTGNPCDTAAGAVPQRGYARSAGLCIECGSCGEQACPPTFANQCGSGLTPFPSTGANVCWMGAQGSCSPPKTGGGSSSSGGGSGSGSGSSGGKGGSSSGGTTCECTSANADSNIAKCGAGLFELCDPAVPQSSPDKSRICRPTLGCTLDANGGGSYRCTLPTPQDHWPSPCGDSTSQLSSCWSSAEVGLCEDGAPKSKSPMMCHPVTCAAEGAQCGLISDGCGGTLECGTCPSLSTCQSGQCVHFRIPVLDGNGGGVHVVGECGGHLCE